MFKKYLFAPKTNSKTIFLCFLCVITFLIVVEEVLLNQRQNNCVCDKKNAISNSNKNEKLLSSNERKFPKQTFEIETNDDKSKSSSSLSFNPISNEVAGADITLNPDPISPEFNLSASSDSEPKSVETEIKPLTTMDEALFLQLINDTKQGIIEKPIDFVNTQVCVTSGNCQPVQEYMKWKADEYIAHVNKHLKINRTVQKLKPFEKNSPEPNQQTLKPNFTIDDEGIDRELKMERERRMKLGDDDMLQNQAVQKVISQNSSNLIPNIVHFIWFGCKKFKVHHHLCFLSVLRYQKPDLILFHTNCTPTGDLWDRSKNLAGNTLLIMKRTPPISVFGNPIKVVEHQSDVARLHILFEYGGIYIDTDFWLLRSLDELRGQNTVLAAETKDNLGNGIILTLSKSWFLRKWFEEYKSFNDSKWSEHSCFVPWHLWKKFPSMVTVEEERLLRPNWTEFDLLYKELCDWRKNYGIHLYARYLPWTDGVEERTFKEFAVLNTTYGEIARHILWGDYRIREPKNILFM